MPSLPLIVTDAGLAAANAANSQGLTLDITAIALGDGAGTPTEGTAALVHEVKRITDFGGTTTNPEQLHLTLRDSSADVYNLREIGLYAGSTLFAVYGGSNVLLAKAAGANLLLTAIFNLSRTPPGTVTINGPEFDYPNATETVFGTAPLATEAQVDAGTDGQRIVTPLRLAQRLAKVLIDATTQLKGLIMLATQSEVNDGNNGTKAVTPQTLASHLADRLQIATEAQAGLIRAANSTEVNIASDYVVAVTPRTLKGYFDLKLVDATVAQRGLVRFATDLEKQQKETGLAVDPKGVDYMLQNFTRAASESQAGMAEAATTAEVTAGTDDSRFVTPKKLAQRLAAMNAFPAGTTMLFVQTSAPTGWTKSINYNDRVLRIVSSFNGTGGSTAFSDVFKTRYSAGNTDWTMVSGTVAVNSHTVTESQMPSHNHSAQMQQIDGNFINIARMAQGSSSTSTGLIGDTGGDGSHSHTAGFIGDLHRHAFTSEGMDFNVRYLDAIVAVKN